MDMWSSDLSRHPTMGRGHCWLSPSYRSTGSMPGFVPRPHLPQEESCKWRAWWGYECLLIHVRGRPLPMGSISSRTTGQHDQNVLRTKLRPGVPPAWSSLSSPLSQTPPPAAYSCSLTLCSIQVLLLTNPVASSPIMEASQTTWTNTSSLSQYLCLYVSLSSTNWALNLSLQTALLYISVSATPVQTLNDCNKLLPDLLPLTDPSALILKPFWQLLIFYRIRLKSLCFAWHVSPSFTWPWLPHDQSLGT